MTAMFGVQFGAPGPLELLIIVVSIILVLGRWRPPFVYSVGQRIAAVQQQPDSPRDTHYPKAIFLCLLAVIGWLVLLMLLDR